MLPILPKHLQGGALTFELFCTNRQALWGCSLNRALGKLCTQPQPVFVRYQEVCTKQLAAQKKEEQMVISVQVKFNYVTD